MFCPCMKAENDVSNRYTERGAKKPNVASRETDLNKVY